MAEVSKERAYVAELESQFWRRGLTPSGMAWVWSLLRDQHPPESVLWREFEAARKGLDD